MPAYDVIFLLTRPLMSRGKTTIVSKIVGTIAPVPPPPELNNVEISSYRSGEATQLCAGEGGGGGGIIPSSHMISSVWEGSTEFVVRVLLVTVDYEAAFQLK